jgi:hypothetical protein
MAHAARGVDCLLVHDFSARCCTSAVPSAEMLDFEEHFWSGVDLAELYREGNRA